MSLATDVASVLVSSVAVLVAAIALKVTRQAAKAQETQSQFQVKQYELNSIILIHQFFSTTEAREVRRRIYGRYQALKNGVPSSPKEENEIAMVGGDIDIVGSLITDLYVPKDAFLKMYSGMVCNMWEILGPSIKQERDKRKEPIYKHYFEDLAKDAKAYREKNGWPVLTIREAWNPEDMPEFLVERFTEKTEKPVISNFTLRIRCTTGAYEKCTVWFDGAQCFSERSNEAVPVRILMVGDVLNFRIPYTSVPVPGKSFMEIKDGERTLLRKSWDDINWTSP
jgi:hypothetical protein